MSFVIQKVALLSQRLYNSHHWVAYVQCKNVKRPHVDLGLCSLRSVISKSHLSK